MVHVCLILTLGFAAIPVLRLRFLTEGLHVMDHRRSAGRRVLDFLDRLEARTTHPSPKLSPEEKSSLKRFFLGALGFYAALCGIILEAIFR